MKQHKNQESSIRDKTEFDDSPECSQNSALAFSSQSDCELVANMIPVQDNFKPEEDSVKKEAADAELCPHEYYSSVVDATRITEMHHSGGLVSVTASNQNSLHDDEEPENVVHRVVSPHLSSNSFPEIIQKSEGLMKTLDHSSDHDNATHGHKSDIRVKNSTATTSIVSSEQQKHMLSEADCSTSMIFEAEMNRDFPFAVPFPSSNFVNLSCFRGTGNYQSELHSSGTSIDLALSSQTLFPVIPSSSPGNSYCQGFIAAVAPSFLCQSDGKFLDRSGSVGVADTSVGIQDSEVMPSTHADFSYSSSSPIASAGGDKSKIYLPEDINQEKEIPKKTFIELMGPGPTGAMENLSLSDGNGNEQTESKNAGGLFYEPPRIPTFEIPFASCDLISSSEQQAFSPFGIRQIMMSSTPYNVWDSPSHDDSPDAILKSAAKSFICTPSIMKKRQRELLSPLQEKRMDKKYGRDMKRGFMYTSCISKEFSCIDSPINENVANRISSCSAEDFLVSPTNDHKKDSETYTQPAENLDPSICHDDGNVSGKRSDGSKLQEKMERSATRINVPMKISVDIPNRRVSLFPLH